MTVQTTAPRILRSPWPAPDVPDVALTDYVLRYEQRLAGKPALVDAASARTIEFGQLGRAIDSAAAGLAAGGFGAGDVLAIHAPNLPEFAVAAHAAMALGGVVTTVNPLYTAKELAHQLSDSGARVLVTVPAFLETARAAARAAGLRQVYVFGEADGARPFAALLETGGRGPIRPIEPDSVGALLYSSGTTGLPKGVELTHRAMVANLEQLEQVLGVGEADTVLAVAPFFHTLGFTVLLNHTLACGATVVSMPRFELEAFLQAIEDHRATVTIVVPPIALALARHPAVDRFDLSSLRIVGCGAAPLSAAIEQECADRLGCAVHQGYGMTEAACGIAISNMVEPERNRRGQAGLLLPGTDARVVDIETGAELGAGDTGELWVRGPQLMRGYRNNPDATAATIDGDGWLHTGDIGFVDDEGRVFITDRLKELIKFKAFQVAPAELEALLDGHPSVADVAVVGAPDEEACEIPVAFVVLREQLADEELMAWVAERVAPHKRVRRVERVNSIPRSPAGKILRRELRAML